MVVRRPQGRVVVTVSHRRRRRRRGRLLPARNLVKVQGEGKPPISHTVYWTGWGTNSGQSKGHLYYREEIERSGRLKGNVGVPQSGRWKRPR